MIYISKGLVCKGSTEELLEVTYRGRSFQLTGTLAYIWLNGRYGLETQMEYAEKRDAVVDAILRLLRKKKIVIL